MYIRHLINIRYLSPLSLIITIIVQGRYFEPQFINGKPIAYPREAATNQDLQLLQVGAGSGCSAPKVHSPPPAPSTNIKTEVRGPAGPWGKQGREGRRGQQHQQRQNSVKRSHCLPVDPADVPRESLCTRFSSQRGRRRRAHHPREPAGPTEENELALG